VRALNVRVRCAAAAGFEEALRLTRHKNTTGFTPSLSGYALPPPCCVAALEGWTKRNAAFDCQRQRDGRLPADAPLQEAPPETFRWAPETGEALLPPG
jgi:hypothetical protein